MNSPEVKYLKDYQQSHFDIEHVDLYFNIYESHTDVRAIIKVKRVKDFNNRQKNLYLNGESDIVELKSVSINGDELHEKEYTLTSEQLIINRVGTDFLLKIETRLKPHENTSLSGLYKSNDIICTQCEAEGFRRITYFLDRPDIMCAYTCTIEADYKKYPILLSNGNLIQSGKLDNGRHWVTWEDPFPKPSYLFAVVAGDLDYLEDTIYTEHGDKVTARIYAEEENIDRCDFALESLITAILWEEEVFHLEYDLDTYNIVAINDFNMGAMENKGLNIFNAKYILADPEVATDEDYANIERVIAHEYFHNWTGNRITLRDWFQLCLKEGLTVYRDQMFAEMRAASKISKRIQDAKKLRLFQFREDDGPLAHPVRPDQYIEMNNFYTMTVYEKGAVVIRMLHSLLGDDFFIGMGFYVDQYDGNAVTVENFLESMEEASERNLKQFKTWYTQAGTPRVNIKRHYDPEVKIYQLRFEQSCPPTPGQPKKEPLMIPVTIAFIDSDGNHCPLRLREEVFNEDDDDNQGKKNDEPIEIDDDENEVDNPFEERTLELTKPFEIFNFMDIPEDAVPSIFRGYAPCAKVTIDYSLDERFFLMLADTDDFSRWDNSRFILLDVLFQLVLSYEKKSSLSIHPDIIFAFENILETSTEDPILATELIKIPTETEIAHYCADQTHVINPEAILHARNFMLKTIAQKLENLFHTIYDNNISDEPYEFEPAEVARRSIKNIALEYLVALDTSDVISLALDQIYDSDNMTDVFSALQSLSHANEVSFQEACDFFYEQWHDEPLVLDKWFSVQAQSSLKSTFSRFKELLSHPDFTLNNPNRVRALIGSLVHGNHYYFHLITGEAYQVLGDQVLALDKMNPQIASRMVSAFNYWKKYDHERQELMKAQLNRILAEKLLSKDVYEIASKALAE